MSHVLLSVLLLSVVTAVPARSNPSPECPPWQLGQYLQTGSRDGVKDLVNNFIRAYNKGDAGALDELFPQEPGFEGYWAEPERMWEKGEDRSTLLDYFDHRHDLDDRLALRTLRIQHHREERGWDFYFELRRTSDQNRARGFYVGKGAADCAISVWNMDRRRA
jgi:hypothetical protein